MKKDAQCPIVKRLHHLNINQRNLATGKDME